MIQKAPRPQVLKSTFFGGLGGEGLGHQKLNLSSKGSEPERRCLNCRAGWIWGSDHGQRVPTAVPMGTMSGRAPAQNEQPASGLNLAGADVGTGLARATRRPRFRRPRGGCDCRDQPGRQVAMETKLLAFPGAWSSDRETILHRAPSPLGPSLPSQTESRACHGHRDG